MHDPFRSQFKIYNFTLNHDFHWAGPGFFRRRISIGRMTTSSTPPSTICLSAPTSFPSIGLSTPDALTDQYDTSRYFTNELRLASKLDGPSQFVVGLFQQHIHTSFETLVATVYPDGYLKSPLEPVFGQLQAHSTEQYALFGEYSYKFTDKRTGKVGRRPRVLRRGS